MSAEIKRRTASSEQSAYPAYANGRWTSGKDGETRFSKQRSSEYENIELELKENKSKSAAIGQQGKKEMEIRIIQFIAT